MKKIVLLISFSHLLFYSFAQTNDIKVRYVYSNCTEEARKELFEILKEDKVKLKEVYKKYYSMCKSGKVILSSDQYLPIAKEIEKIRFKENKENSESEIFAKIAREKYIIVTDLIDK